MPGSRFLLAGWELASRLALRRFRAQLTDGAALNAATLRAILTRAADTEFGRLHDFQTLSRARDVEAAFAAEVPVSTYADVADAMRRIADGAENVLFPGRPRMFVSTSGTTGDPRLFPVTTRQQNAALKFIALLTPAARAACVPGLGFQAPTATLMVASRPGRATAAGIPVGNPSGAGIRRILAFAPPFWVFPPEVLTLTDYPTALYLHALFALRAPQLRCIEAIYASHVVNWMALIVERREQLVRDIADGTLSHQLSLSAVERELLQRRITADPHRAQAVDAALAGPDDEVMTRLWPALTVLSCVISGAFAVSVPRLRTLAGPAPALYTTCFGATEGMVGINLWADAPERYALALGASHIEFLPEDQLEAALPRTVSASTVEPGRCYELVLTNHAGLYRYRLGDVVRIADFVGTTPVFEFDHRRGNVIDLVGEKTTEQHVRDAMAKLLQEWPEGQAAMVDYTVYPDSSRVPYRYVAYLEVGAGAATVATAGLPEQLDRFLSVENPSYATLARANGRLAQVEIRQVRPGTFAQLLARLRDAAEGVNANQVKVPRVLRSSEHRKFLESSATGEAGR